MNDDTGGELSEATGVKASKWRSAVAPWQPVTREACPPRKPTFVQAFGLLGVPLLFIIAISMLWTVWLLCLNVAPNATTNYLMDTEPFDDGDFWLIADPEPVLLVFTVLCLGCVLAMYGYVVLKMTRWRELALSTNAVLKTVDLALQTTALHRILEYGFSPVLCFCYATLVTANALSCAAFILDPRSHSALTEVLVDTVFDMFFAVGAPIVLLQHAYTHFTFGRERALLARNLLLSETFERMVRLTSDPSQATSFLLSFDALRTTTWRGLAAQASMNMTYGYRLKRVVDVYSSARRLTRQSTAGRLLAADVAAQVRVPRCLSVAFLAVGVLALVYAHKAVDDSRRVCQPFAECATYAHRWTRQDACPCLAFIDVDKAPRTFEQWTRPKDVTARVQALAASGDLLVLHVINRGLAPWPDELQRCTQLRHITLMYTGVEEIPAWAKRLTNLEFLSIEGKPSARNLRSLPDGLFDAMPGLSHLHLGTHPRLTRLPSLDALGNLKTLSLALLLSLRSLPDLTRLVRINTIELLMLPELDAVPALAADARPSKLIMQLSRFCCDGFLGSCAPSHAACRGLTAATCSAAARPSGSLARALETHQASVCTWDATLGAVPVERLFTDPARREADKCGGELYRQCEPEPPGAGPGQAMCFNVRFMAVACVAAPGAVRLRRAEIRAGRPCDSRVEAWLGCGGASAS